MESSTNSTLIGFGILNLIGSFLVLAEAFESISMVKIAKSWKNSKYSSINTHKTAFYIKVEGEGWFRVKEPIMLSLVVPL